jgi:hypothetical protein
VSFSVTGGRNPKEKAATAASEGAAMRIKENLIR